MNVEQRFWSKVSLPNENGCMLWTAGKTRFGYGWFNFRGKNQTAHRVSLILTGGEPPKASMDAAHAPEICHNPACVAPNHLRWATRKENMQDKTLDGTNNAVRGEAHYRAKLTSQDVADIRRIYADGSSYRKLAEQFEVSFAMIRNVVKERNWK